MRQVVSSKSSIERFVRAFRDKTLPKSEWTHEDHFVTALWHIREYGFEDAVERMRTGIRAYNVAVGGRNTDTEGYHETITLLYMDALADFSARHNAEDGPKLYNRLLDDELIDRAFPLRFYSKEHLFSVEARRRWVAPDLTLPDFLRR